MRVDFDPTTDAARGEQVVDSVERIAGQHLDLSGYEELELFLFQGVPEKDVRQQEFTRHLRSAAGSGRSAAVSGKPEKSSQSADP
jgi:hypothetical protein